MEAINPHRLLENKKELFLYLVIILLTLTSSQFIYYYLIYCGPSRNDEEAARLIGYQKQRLEIQTQILSGEAPAHLQYRVFKPAATKILQVILSPLIKDPVRNHINSSRILIYLTFLLIYYFFSKFLRLYYSPEITIIGLLLLWAIIPLSIEPNPTWAEGNFYNLLFFAIGMYLMFKNREHYLPILFVFGSLNREQFLFFNVLYATYLISEKRLFRKKGITILTVNFIIWLSVYLGLRFYFGFKPNYSTISFEIHNNIVNWWHISQVWIEEVFIFLILCVLIYRRCNKFFEYSFVSLGLFIILFFMNGHMNELSKFLPAYLIMIPMALRIFAEEKEKVKVKNTEEHILYNYELEHNIRYRAG